VDQKTFETADARDVGILLLCPTSEQDKGTLKSRTALWRLTRQGLFPLTSAELKVPSPELNVSEICYK